MLSWAAAARPAGPEPITATFLPVRDFGGVRNHPAARKGGVFCGDGRRGDLRVRLAAFEWLKEQVEVHGDVLPRPILEQGFEFEGQRVSMLGPQGMM